MADWDHWRTQQILDERAVVEHIRRNGYITHGTLGDVGFAERGFGDRIPCMNDNWRRWDREPSIFPTVTRKYDPMW